MAADTGNSAEIAFGTSSFSANFTMLSGPSLERPKINTSHLGTTDYETYIPGDLVDGGEIEGEFQLDMDALFDSDDLTVPIDGAAETITITFPSALANGAELAFSGFLTRFEIQEIRNNTLMLGRMTIAVAGTPTFTDATA